MMHAAVKLLIGLIFVGIGLYLLVPGSLLGLTDKGFGVGVLGDLEWWGEFVDVIQGAIPPMLILLGVLIVWIESEELKSPSVPDFEEEKPKKETKKKGK